MGIVAMKKGGEGCLHGYRVKQNKMKAKSSQNSLYRIKINISESNFPGSCIIFDDLFSSV